MYVYVYKAVTTALLEINEYNASGSYMYSLEQQREPEGKHNRSHCHTACPEAMGGTEGSKIDIHLAGKNKGLLSCRIQ